MRSDGRLFNNWQLQVDSFIAMQLMAAAVVNRRTARRPRVRAHLGGTVALVPLRFRTPIAIRSRRSGRVATSLVAAGSDVHVAHLSAAETPTDRSGAGLQLIALSAWSIIGIGAAIDNGEYTKMAVAFVTAGTGLLILGAVGVGALGLVASTVVRGGVATAFVAAVAGALFWPAGLYGTGPWLTASRSLTLLATVLIGGWFVARLPRAWIAASTATVLQGAAGVAMVASSPRPRIDDWVMLQAACRGLSRGQNIYTVAWAGPVHEASNLFAYLPGSAVLVWPFHALFGDVRYGILAGLVLTCAILIWLSRRSPLALLGCLPLLYPKSLFGLEQSWIDPLVLLGVCGACLAVSRGRRGWAVICLAAALACKQQAWLILPLAMAWREFGWRRSLLSAGLAGGFVLPWAIADLHRFFFDVFQYQLGLPPFSDSLSLVTTAIARGFQPGLAWLVASTTCALALALWRIPRDTPWFLFGAALVMAVFNLTNKQSFFNEWQLAAGLAGAAAIFAASGGRRESPTRSAVGRDPVTRSWAPAPVVEREPALGAEEAWR